MSKIALFLPIFLLVILGLRLVQNGHKTSKYINGQAIDTESFLLNEPQVFGNRQQFFITDQNGTTFTVITPIFPAFHYGDFVHVSGTVKARVLNNEKTVNSIYFPHIEAKDFDNSVTFGLVKTTLLWSRVVREQFLTLFHSTLPSREANLLIGIVLGVKEPLPQSFSQDLRNAGVFHVVAASGMNVTMVASFFTVMLAGLLRRQLVLIVTIAAIWFYAIIAGFQPSIVRAAVMGTAVFFGQLLGRQNMPIYSLSLTALLMLIITPTLYSDIGFELSFASTLGLVLLSPLQKIRLFTVLGSFGEDVATTFSAQLSTLPILLLNFGSYSPWSVLINGLVLWTVPPLMVLGGLAGMVGFLLRPVGILLTYLCLPFLWFFETVVSLFGRFTQPIMLQSIPILSVLGYYLILFGFIFWLRQKAVHEESDF